MDHFFGTFIKLYIREGERCRACENKPLNKVVAEIALELGISDFVEYKAMEGYIFDRKLHTAMREVLHPALPVIIEIFTSENLANEFIERVKPLLSNSAMIVVRNVEGMFFRG